MRLPHAADTRLLVAGIVASLALVAYLAVAFATTHASVATASRVAPWTAYRSKLTAAPYGPRGRYSVWVRPTGLGSYGGLIPTLVSDPTPKRRFEVGFWLQGSRGGPAGVAIDEFRPGATSVYVVDTTIRVPSRWHHFTFSAWVKGSWLGLGMFVSRRNDAAARTWFAVRGLTAGLSRH